MNNLILGIIIGIAIWQFICMVFCITMTFSKKDEAEFTTIFSCGIFYLIFLIIGYTYAYIREWYIQHFHIVIAYYSERHLKENDTIKKENKIVSNRFRISKFLLKKYKIGKSFCIKNEDEDAIIYNWLEIEPRRLDHISPIITLRQLGYIKNNINKYFKK